MTKEKKSVSLWHPWSDKPGRRHTTVLFDSLKKETQHMDLEHIVEYISQQKLYCFVNDLMDEEEIPYNESLLLHKQSEAFISKTGKIVALQVKQKNKTGFFIPCSVWGRKGLPSEEFVYNHNFILRLFRFEALTPASLSEKVLRDTLPEKTYIYRPTDMIRQTFLDNSHGGRIDENEEAKRFKRVYSYDVNKAYLFFSRLIPSPFIRPDRMYYGSDGKQDDRWQEYPTAWMECLLIAHCKGKHPIQIEDNDIMREPVEGEVIHTWLWSEELKDCLEVGYTLHHIEQAYGFIEMSDFMCEWSDILYDGLQMCENAEQKGMVKKMMVGLPGRFLKSPMNYSLIHQRDFIEGDEPILRNWLPGGPITSPWYIRGTPDLESAQLTPLGHYIIMKCRQDIARRIRAEERLGNEVLDVYIDCYTVRDRTKLTDRLDENVMGHYKEKIIDQEVVLVQNQIIPENIDEMRAPGFAREKEDGTIGERRQALWEKYHGEKQVS